MRILCLFSGGKDSSYALHRMLMSGFDVVALLTIRSRNPDSWLYQVPGMEISHLFQRLTGIPVEIFDSPEDPEDEERELSRILGVLRSKYNLDAVCSGAFLSDYQRMRFTNAAYENGLISYTPLWRKDGRRYMEELAQQGFSYILLSYASAGFTPNLLGKEVDGPLLEKLLAISDRWGSHPAFEGGEAETLVIKAPLYKGSLEISGGVEQEGEYNARFIIEEARIT